jgi:HemY protein
MIRVLVYVVVVFLLAAGVVWLAERPGELLIDWQGYEIRTSVMVAVVGAAMLIALIAIVGALLRAVVRTPQTVGSFFGTRRRDRGYRALSRGMIAVGAGDMRAAQRAARESQSLLGKSEPLVLLLSAQAAQIAGDGKAARSAFTALSETTETRILGLHGLFVEARRADEHAAARHFAEEAMRLSPRVAWAGTALFDYQCQAGDWQGALTTLAANAEAGTVDRARAQRLRAVLLTGRAMALEAGAPDEARTLAMEAQRLAPDLVPASVTAARLLTRNSDFRRAARILEAAWKAAPHPDIAAAYAAVRTGDSVRDRLKRVRKLADLRANHAEGAIAIARAAIDARDWPAAREALGGTIRLQPSEGVCLLMAEIEEGEHGDQGRVRAWLARALGAPRDPAWIADGRVFAAWAPVSPVSGRVDAFEWKLPPARLPAERQMEIEAWAADADAPPAVEAKALTAEPAPAPVVEVPPAPPPKPAETGVESKPAEPKPAGPKAVDARPADARPVAVTVIAQDLMPRAPDDPGPPRREDEDERYKVF